MLIVMSTKAGQDQIDTVLEAVKKQNLTPHNIPGSIRVAIGITGNTGAIDPHCFSVLPDVVQVIRVTSPHKLVSRETKPDDTVVHVGPAEFGGKKLAIIAGPCSVEDYEIMIRTAESVKQTGACMLRGGVYKPRTSPYSFQGLGKKGLDILSRVREETGMPFVTEVIDRETVAVAKQYADMLQVGARNMQNFRLLKAVGASRKPVLLKRGISSTMEEFLMAAEYIMSEGNYNIVLCERGIRTFVNHTRFTLDIGIIPSIKKLTHLPVIADPSHAAGARDKVISLALGALGAGADGLIAEVHPEPEHARSDGAQSLYPFQFSQLMEKVNILAGAVDRTV